MESILDHYSDNAQILEFRRKTEENEENELLLGMLLVNSRNKDEVSEGIDILKEILKNAHFENTRICVYHIALGYARKKEYSKCLDHIDALIRSEPTNKQAIQLRNIVKQKLAQDGFTGAIIAGGAVALVTAVLFKLKF